MTDMHGSPMRDATPVDDSNLGNSDDQTRSLREAQSVECARQPIGVVLEIAGSGSAIALDMQRLNECMSDIDPSIALAGQVGSQIKIKTGDGWLLASVRNQRQDRRGDGNSIVANIDFLGEGMEERLTGKIHSFRRGVTRYPIPGALVFPATSEDLRQIYASDGRSAIQVGTVYPTSDIRAGVYIDAMLGKHFALLGSTGTGKSTSAALILHRICQAAPQGHILMIDPHGEYSAAFRNTGQIFDVSNLQMPYWLMNFEEHCEVLLKSSGNDLQNDRDILAKCLLHARGKNRLAEQLGKITVDSPIPYLLSDLTGMIQDEMGKLDKATNTAPYMRIKTKIDELKSDPRYQFMFSGMLVSDTMADFIGKIFRMPGPAANRFRSSMCLVCRPTSPVQWWPFSAALCSISPSGAGMKKPARSCSFAKRRTAMCPMSAMRTATRSEKCLAVSPRKAVNTGFRLV